jgi:hypothetical protein
MVSPMWFPNVIMALDLGVFVNLLWEIGILTLALVPVGPMVGAKFARNLMAFLLGQGICTALLYGDFVDVYWLKRVPATTSVAEWWVRLIYAGGMLLFSSGVIAMLMSRLTDRPGWYWRVGLGQFVVAGVAFTWLALT